MTFCIITNIFISICIFFTFYYDSDQLQKQSYLKPNFFHRGYNLLIYEYTYYSLTFILMPFLSKVSWH